MDVLIAPVGKQDPVSTQNQQPGSVLAIAAKVRPRLVFLLPTRKPAQWPDMVDPREETYEQAVATKASLEALLPQVVVEIVPLEVGSPQLLVEILPAVERAVERIQQELPIWGEGDAVALHVNAGSGTPAIKQAMTLLVSSGVLVGEDGRAAVYVVDDPQFVGQNADRVHLVDISRIEELHLIPHLLQVLDARQWLLAHELVARLATIVSNGERGAVAATLARLLNVYCALDRLNYQQAHTDLKQLRTRKETRVAAGRLVDLQLLIDDSLTLVERLAGGDRPAILYDLVCNAGHRLRRGEYADALARCWHAIESTLRLRIAAVHGIDLDTRPLLSSDRQRLLGEALAIDIQGRVKRQQYVGQLWEALRLLDDTAIVPLNGRALDPTLGAAINACHRRLVTPASQLATDLRARFRQQAAAGQVIATWADLCAFLNEVRNHSVVAHGEHEVPAEIAEASVKLATELLRVCVQPVGAVTDAIHLMRFDQCLRMGVVQARASGSA